MLRWLKRLRSVGLASGLAIAAVSTLAGAEDPPPAIRVEMIDGREVLLSWDGTVIAELTDTGELATFTLGPTPPQLPGWPVVVGEVESTPTVGDLDGDSVLEVVFTSLDENLYVVRSDASGVAGWPFRIGRSGASPALVDVDGDGTLEVFVGRDGFYGFRHDVSILPGWPQSSDSRFHGVAADDLDLDGRWEIVTGDRGHAYLWEHSGAQEAGWPFTFPTSSDVFAFATFGDVDGDGVKEIAFPVVGSFGTPSLYLFSIDGTLLSGFPIRYESGLGHGLSMADVEGDGTQELWFFTRRNGIWILDGAANPLPGWPRAYPGAGNRPPAIGDIDDDGRPEMVWATPGGDGQVFAYNHDGTELPNWPRTVPSFAFNSQVTLGDVDGDGGVDIVVGGLTADFSSVGRIYAWHADGTPVEGFPFAVPENKAIVFSSVTITDLDQDGDVDLLVGAVSGIHGARSGRVFAFDLDAPYNPNTMEWPTESHDIRNTGRWEPLPCPDHDVDIDAVCGPVDNCPTVANPGQEDSDADGVGDVCDICPALPNPAQSEPVACLAMAPDGGQCLSTVVELTGASPSGEIRVYGREPSVPESITFEVLSTSCETAEELRFSLNGTDLGGVNLDPYLICSCDGWKQTHTVSVPAVLQAAWSVPGGNVMGLAKDGAGTAVAWVRVRLTAAGTDETVCLFDAGGGGCDVEPLCDAGFAFDLPPEQMMLDDPLLADVLRNTTTYAGSSLPTLLDLAGVPDGPVKLCLTDGDPSDPQMDCVGFTKAGEEALAINGTSCYPTAAAGLDVEVECTSAVGATVVLDGTGSSDVNSSTGTNDDIVLFEWFGGFGTSSQTLIGTGDVLTAELGLGPHNLTLQVTDSFGASGVDDLLVRVVDTTPPELAVSLTPSLLWPPDHQMVEVTVTTRAFDWCGETVAVLESVTSSEPDDAPGGGDGHTVGDIHAAASEAGDLRLRLRAERAGRGDGRTYTVTYRATDAAGNSVTASSAVVVPHDQGR